MCNVHSLKQSLIVDVSVYYDCFKTGSYFQLKCRV